MMGSRTWALEPGQAERLHSTQILLTTPTFPCPPDLGVSPQFTVSLDYVSRSYASSPLPPTEPTSLPRPSLILECPSSGRDGTPVPPVPILTRPRITSLALLLFIPPTRTASPPIASRSDQKSQAPQHSDHARPPGRESTSAPDHSHTTEGHELLEDKWRECKRGGVR